MKYNLQKCPYCGAKYEESINKSNFNAEGDGHVSATLFCPHCFHYWVEYYSIELDCFKTPDGITYMKESK